MSPSAWSPLRKGFLARGVLGSSRKPGFATLWVALLGFAASLQTDEPRIRMPSWYRMPITHMEQRIRNIVGNSFTKGKRR